MISAITVFLTNNPTEEPEDSQDVLAVLTETIRANIMVNKRIIIEPDSHIMNLLFNIAELGDANLYLTGLISDCFEDSCQELYTEFIPLCGKVLPIVNQHLDQGAQAAKDKDLPMTSVRNRYRSLIFRLSSN